MAASAVSRGWLEWVGRLAKEEPRPSGLRSEPDRFACLLEKQPGLLVPQRFVQSRLTDGGDQTHPPTTPHDGRKIVWNPRCVLCKQHELPSEVNQAEEWREGFSFSQHTTAWVHDEGRTQWRPFWMEEDLAARMSTAQRSGFSAGQFDADETEVLLNTGILTTETKQASANGQWEEAIAHNRERFRARGYCAVDGLLHPFHLGELRRYYRRLIRQGRVALGDYQSKRRYVAHNEPVERFFHLQLTGAVSQLVGEPVKPSYVYLASYLSGAKLPRHTDREQCEFSVSLCLDYAPEPAEATPWPLHLETPCGRVTVLQALGDALLYRGCELPHYRDPLPEGHLSTSLFFHYVRADFAGPLA